MYIREFLGIILEQPHIMSFENKNKISQKKMQIRTAPKRNTMSTIHKTPTISNETSGRLIGQQPRSQF